MFEAKKWGIEFPDSENLHTITDLEGARETEESPFREMGHGRRERKEERREEKKKKRKE